MRIAIDASARRLTGIAAGIGVAGLDCAPLALTIADGVIGAFSELPCAIDSVNAGITLNRLRATLRHGAPGWSLHELAGELFGGRFAAASVGPLGAAPIDASLSLHAIDLAQIGKLLDDPDLTLTGMLDGTIPVHIEGGTFTVSQGEVHSTAPGVIRYRPAVPPPGESAQIALSRKALSNLEFDTLDATLDYAPDGKLALAARIRGRNPDLDAKRPVHLNLTLETNLRTLLRSLTTGDRISEWLETPVGPPSGGRFRLTWVRLQADDSPDESGPAGRCPVIRTTGRWGHPPHGEPDDIAPHDTCAPRAHGRGRLYADGEGRGARETDHDQPERQDRARDPRQGGPRARIAVRGRQRPVLRKLLRARTRARRCLETTMRKMLKVLLTAAAITAGSAALALDVQEAKSAGWVGEQRDGYLGLVAPSAPPEAKQLLTEINQARRASYQEIAAKNGIELRAVELLAAEKALQRTQSGQFIQAEDGSWVKK